MALTFFTLTQALGPCLWAHAGVLPMLFSSPGILCDGKDRVLHTIHISTCYCSYYVLLSVPQMEDGSVMGPIRVSGGSVRLPRYLSTFNTTVFWSYLPAATHSHPHSFSLKLNPNDDEKLSKLNHSISSFREPETSKPEFRVAMHLLCLVLKWGFLPSVVQPCQEDFRESQCKAYDSKLKVRWSASKFPDVMTCFKSCDELSLSRSRFCALRVRIVSWSG